MLDKILSFIASAFAVKTKTIESTNSSITAVKRSGVIVVRFNGFTNLPAGWTTLGTLPEGWRPREELFMRPDTPEKTLKLRINIRADGTILVYNYGALIEKASNAREILTFVSGGGTVKAGISMLSAIERRWRHARQDFKLHSGKAVTDRYKLLRQCEREHYIHEREHTGSRCEHHSSGRNLYHQSTSWISDSLRKQNHKHSTWSDGFRMGLPTSRFCRWLMVRIGGNSHKDHNRTDNGVLFGIKHKDCKLCTNKDRSRSYEVKSDWGCASC